MTRPSPIQAALGRHRLAQVVRRTGIALTTDNGAVTVRCPLPTHGHPDRTPSLRLYLDDDRYYCFGCAAKGDVIQWARDTEGVGVHDAISALDSGRTLTNAWTGATTRAAANVSPPRPPTSDTPGSLAAASRPETPDLGRTPPERVLAALAAAWDYYTTPTLHARATAYLTRRSIDVTVLEAHTGQLETGHTPARTDSLVAALQARGFSDDELVDAGLAHRPTAGTPLSHFYRQRVLIPLRDDNQHIVGLIGRNVGDPQRWAKYKNPPRTAVYDKSVNLYQPLPAPVEPHGAVIIVEGTLDALAIAVAAIRTGQADRYCPITQSGRELSDTQLLRILAMHPAPPVLAFDGDLAGRDSAARYRQAFAAHGRPAIVTSLPAEHDPASWLATHGDAGLQAWQRSGADARRGLSELRSNVDRRNGRDTRSGARGRTGVSRQLLPAGAPAAVPEAERGPVAL